jgi:hypothetical protein
VHAIKNIFNFAQGREFVSCLHHTHSPVTLVFSYVTWCCMWFSAAELSQTHDPGLNSDFTLRSNKESPDCASVTNFCACGTGRRERASRGRPCATASGPAGHFSVYLYQMHLRYLNTREPTHKGHLRFQDNEMSPNYQSCKCSCFPLADTPSAYCMIRN